ncbi:SbcC/MukB-like Walker B domain-containing protein [Asticcacaulis solisilvae]|uniref:SbcC/MukB-like Walker B domain-containing protein n=1 Tax=Asticcacaulis solisilvae TaxID=1217274 RepID=UPI003FD80633
MRSQRQVIEQRLQHEGFESFEALNDGIEAGETDLAQRVESRRAAQGAFDEERKKHDSAKQVEARFVAAELARDNLARLTLKANEINEVRAQVINARRAEALLDVEGQVIRAEADVRTADEAVGVKKLAFETAEGEVIAAGADLAEVRAMAGEIDSLRKACDQLGRFETKLLGTSALAAALAAADGVHDEKGGARASAATAVSDLKAKKEGDATKLATERQLEGERVELAGRRARLEGLYQAADAFEKAGLSVEEAQTAHDLVSGRRRTALEQTSGAKTAMEDAERALVSTQALHLAGKLVDGAACPVCGSEHHPHPAVGDITHEGLDSAYRLARKVFEDAQREDVRLVGELAAAAATLKERQILRDRLTRPEDKAAAYLADLTDLKGQIDALPTPADIPTQANALLALDGQIRAAEEILEAARQAFTDAEREQALARKELDLALSEIPEELRTVEALDEAKTRSLATLTARITAQTVAEERLNKAKESQAAAKASVEAAAQAQSKAIVRRDRDVATLTARLADAGLSTEEFAAFKLLIAAMPAKALAVEQFERDLGVAEADLVVKTGAIGGAERPDLELSALAECTAELTLQTAVDAHAQAVQALESKTRLKADLLNRKTELETFERATAELRDLASMVSGINAQRTDLETFAIGAMFDQVLNAANQRLRPMTNSRYSLERDGEGSGNARRGLGIRVNDTYTGKGRSPATLSGGETFICALALALGLSDIVESASGKIRLDTIFIDEGFGSLDTENDSGTLDQVLQVLTHLAGHRRAVGVISHVPQVQDMIPNGFYVRKGLAGSTIEPRGNV